MAQARYIDDLVREYLLFSSCPGAAKVFDGEVRGDREKGFRVDRLMDQLVLTMSSYDLAGLRSIWGQLETKLFSRLEQPYIPVVKKFEASLLKRFLVNAVQNNKREKVNEFFEKMAPEIQSQSEWRDWFVLPFLKNPEENPTFALYFSRQWQDTMMLSLLNFLSLAFQLCPSPRLSNLDEEAAKCTALQLENESLLRRLNNALQRQADPNKAAMKELPNPKIPPRAELMDDFSALAKGNSPMESQFSIIKSFIRNFSGPQQSQQQQPSAQPPAHHHLAKRAAPPPPTDEDETVPVRVESHSDERHHRPVSAASTNADVSSVASRRHPQVKRVSQSNSGAAPARSKSAHQNHVSPSAPPLPERDESLGVAAKQPGGSRKTPFLLLSQDEFKEHKGMVLHCKFNAPGSLVASSDSEGALKVWSCTPLLTTSSLVSKEPVTDLEWVPKREHLLLIGGSAKGSAIRLFDLKDKKMLYDLHNYDTTSGAFFQDKQVVELACNPSGAQAAVCIGPFPTAASPSLGGTLLLWDLKTMEIQTELSVEPLSVVVNCCAFNHNGQLLLGGCADGKVRVYDLRRHHCIASWASNFPGEMASVQLSVDETCCYTLSTDGKMECWSLMQTGRKIWEFPAGEEKLGPFYETDKGRNAQGKLRNRTNVVALDGDGNHMLVGANAGGTIFKIKEDGLEKIMELKGHKAPVVAVDWSVAMNCGTCATGSLDGKVKISTLLSP